MEKVHHIVFLAACMLLIATVVIVVIQDSSEVKEKNFTRQGLHEPASECMRHTTEHEPTSEESYISNEKDSDPNTGK